MLDVTTLIVITVVALLTYPSILFLEDIFRNFSSREKLRQQILLMDEMNGVEFEHLVKKIFELDGYKVSTTKLSGDQGGDLIMSKNGNKIAVQIKRSKYSVGNSAVQEVLGARGYYGCKKAYVVTNNYFTSAALQLARANNVELFDRRKFSKLMGQYLGSLRV